MEYDTLTDLIDTLADYYLIMFIAHSCTSFSFGEGPKVKEAFMAFIIFVLAFRLAF